jgi:hypothetical protein
VVATVFGAFCGRSNANTHARPAIRVAAGVCLVVLDEERGVGLLAVLGLVLRSNSYRASVVRDRVMGAIGSA